MNIVLLPSQAIVALWLALFFAVILPPKDFGTWKRVFGFITMFVCFVLYAMAENNLQILKQSAY